jgi:hypothetical protein
MLPGLDSNLIRILGDLLLETIRDRLLDVLFLKLYESATRMKTLRPDGLLWK